MLRMSLLSCWSIVVMSLMVAFTACGEETVRVGIAWQPTAANYDRVILSIEQAGGEAVILPQMRPAGFEYDGEELCSKYTDEMGVLRLDYADIIKRDTYHGTHIDEALAGVQAVVFLGGGDISSTLFAVPQTWHGLVDDSPADATRDVSEYLTMAYCLDHDIPVLGLCRGMQMLGVVSGAPLIQDLSTYFAGLGKEYHYLHRVQRDADGKRHYTPHDVIVIDSTSLLFEIAKTDTIHDVPSWHHQAVGDVTGTPLKVTGVAETDGVDIIEAIERIDKRFALGVQYHPEEAVRKHLTNQQDASVFMPLEEAVRYFEVLIDYTKVHRP